MTDVTLEFELADNARGEALAEELRVRLAAMENVAEVETQADRSRGVAETIAIVAAGVVLIDHGTSAVSSLTRFVRALKELMLELGDLKQAYMEIRGRKVNIAELTDEEIARL